MTERIDHAAQAARVLGNFPHDDIADNATALAWAQVHATLALVEQQRIANLISLHTADSVIVEAGEWRDVEDAIREGLGLA